MSVSIEKILIEHVKWIEGLSKASVGTGILREIYAPDVHYCDPFHDVVGVESIHKIYEKMFDQMDEVKITVTGRAVNGNMAFVSWRMSVRKKKKRGEMEGATRLRFDEKGLVIELVDFYDASIIFEEAVPILGCFMKWLRKRMG